MIFELKEKKDKFLEEAYEKAMEELNNFFGIKWRKNRPPVFVWKDINQLNFFYENNVPKYLGACIRYFSIYLPTLEVFKKRLKFKKDYEEKYKIIFKHELCHLFFKKYSNQINASPVWLTEGVSIFVSGELKYKKSISKFKTFLYFFQKEGLGVYGESGFAVELLIKNFGKQKILKLIKSLSTAKTKTDFNKLFKKIYGEEPTYAFFNNLLKKEK